MVGLPAVVFGTSSLLEIGFKIGVGCWFSISGMRGKVFGLHFTGRLVG